MAECLFPSATLNPQGFNVNLCYLGLRELLNWMQVGAQVHGCMLHSNKERSLVDPLTVILSPNTKLCGDRFGAVSISRSLRPLLSLKFCSRELYFYLFFFFFFLSFPPLTQTETKILPHQWGNWGLTCWI